MKPLTFSGGGKTLVLSEPTPASLWDFALALYGRDGVEADFLAAQDDFGLDVPSLIFALYRAGQGIGFEAESVRAMAANMAVQITEPLRQVRRALKLPPAYLVHDQAQALRQAVKQAEHDSERLLLEALDRLPQEPVFETLEAAVFTLAQTRASPRRQEIETLLKRLANSARNI
jgi:uncharacterized protein (TIGR02444 family)